VLEGGGLNASTARSKVLSKGSRGRIFLIYFLFIVLAWIVTVIFQIPLGIVVAFMRKGNLAGMLPIIQALSAAGEFLSTTLVGPLVTIALTLVYYDQRVRKEGFDLQLMMSNLQGGTPQAAAAAPSA
jgi:hypothetical protein